MEIKLLSKEGTKLKFEIKGETHTFCNLLRKELWNDKNVEFAGYNVPHSLTKEIIFILDAKDPEKALKDAVSRLKDRVKEFDSKFEAIMK
ncbi:MAG: DNA-directed RNA polymerase subunit L [Candidatus Nanoarchaeia archaeon]|nr:DNA-directed RNA polymerase subunit L [Candidatus Nanoarchaeia archaeon]